jgi:hypothetical protein
LLRKQASQHRPIPFLLQILRGITINNEHKGQEKNKSHAVQNLSRKQLLYEFRNPQLQLQINLGAKRFKNKLCFRTSAIPDKGKHYCLNLGIHNSELQINLGAKGLIKIGNHKWE